VEHVGITGRYGIGENRPDGDLEAMERLRRLLKPKGVMLLTIPVGEDAVFAPLHRVYGEKRLPQLLDGLIIEKEEFWIRDKIAHWTLSDKATALKQPSQPYWFGLGLFSLRRP